jgi:hypothetical protein
MSRVDARFILLELAFKGAAGLAQKSARPPAQAVIEGSRGEESRILRFHHEKRIDPEGLKAIMDAGYPAVIMDVRKREAIIAFPDVIPGAMQIPVEDLVLRGNEIPKNMDLVLYSSSTNDASSARITVSIPLLIRMS